MLDPRYVDSREAPERKAPLERAGFVSKQLMAGDVQFPEVGGGVVLIETKKIGQFLQDMADGQLIRQCRRMQESADFNILMLEGAFHVVKGELIGTPYTWNHAWDQILSCQELGVMVERTVDNAQTVERILHLAERYGKAMHNASQADRHPSGNAAISVLSHIHGVGTVIATGLLQQHRSLQVVAGLSEAELQDVPGVGPKTARRIREFFVKDWSTQVVGRKDRPVEPSAERAPDIGSEPETMRAPSYQSEPLSGMAPHHMSEPL